MLPVLVEATLALFGKMLGPDGGEGAETAGGLDVADNADNNLHVFTEINISKYIQEKTNRFLSYK